MTDRRAELVELACDENQHIQTYLLDRHIHDTESENCFQHVRDNSSPVLTGWVRGVITVGGSVAKTILENGRLQVTLSQTAI